MSKFKNILFGAAATVLLAFGVAGAAHAADTLNNGTTLNEASADIPISQIVKAGASVDLSEIKYKITVAPKIYSPKPTEEGVYVYGGTVSNPPIIINADNSATGMTAGADYVSGDAIKTWDYTRSLTDLFGVIDDTNFPQAGMYEFTITDEIEGGTSGDASKWTHTRPEYLLQVLVKNTTDTNGKVTGRAFAGWTLSKKNGTTYEKVNSGADNQDGKAEFESDYIGKSTLNVTKKVSGDYASTTHPFEQTITLYLPDWASATDVESATGPAGALTTSDTGRELSYTVSLKHGETASFVVPVGTRYKVQETTEADGKAVDSANLKYSPTITWGEGQGEQGDGTSGGNTQEPQGNGPFTIRFVSSGGWDDDLQAEVPGGELLATAETDAAGYLELTSTLIPQDKLTAAEIENGLEMKDDSGTPMLTGEKRRFHADTTVYVHAAYGDGDVDLPVSYKVSLPTAHGVTPADSSLPSQTVSKGEKLTIPAVPTTDIPSGCTFLGWSPYSTDSEFYSDIKPHIQPQLFYPGEIVAHQSLTGFMYASGGEAKVTFYPVFTSDRQIMIEFYEVYSAGAVAGAEAAHTYTVHVGEPVPVPASTTARNTYYSWSNASFSGDDLWPAALVGEAPPDIFLESAKYYVNDGM